MIPVFTDADRLLERFLNSGQETVAVMMGTESSCRSGLLTPSQPPVAQLVSSTKRNSSSCPRGLQPGPASLKKSEPDCQRRKSGSFFLERNLSLHVCPVSKLRSLCIRYQPAENSASQVHPLPRTLPRSFSATATHL